MRYFVKVTSSAKAVEFGSFHTRDAARVYAKSKREAGFTATIKDRHHGR